MKKKNIPQELKEMDQWVVWRYGKAKQNGKKPKVPYNAITRKKADVTNSSHYSSFDKAYNCSKENDFDGIGFVFTKDDPFVGIDLDNCRNPKTRKIKKWAMSIITRLDSYTEVSP